MTRAELQRIHARTGRLIMLCNRLLAAMVVLGVLFCAIMAGGMQVLSRPERFFATQAFSVNYMESTERETVLKTGQLNGQAQRDPNWDGIVAGSSIGTTLGSSIPFVGPYLGPVAGAVVGYRMDSRL